MLIVRYAPLRPRHLNPGVAGGSVRGFCSRAPLALSALLILILFSLPRPLPAQEMENREGRKPADVYPEGAELFKNNCTACHSVGEGERVGPDLLGVTLRRKRDWLIGYMRNAPDYYEDDALGRELRSIFPALQMPKIDITPQEAEEILRFIESHEIAPPPGAYDPQESVDATPPAEPTAAGTLSPAGIALTLGLLGLGVGLWGWNRPIPAKLTFVMMLGAAYWSLGGRVYHKLPGNNEGFAPEQPVDFSHRLHAGDLQISCASCHTGVERSPIAGIPEVETCLDCHRVAHVERDDGSPSPEIAKLVRSWETRETDHPEPIGWVRVHDLPDFTRFDHGVHVRNEISCQECHGPVETMDRIEQRRSLSMGWCLDCHRQEKRTAQNATWRVVGATEDCAACHF